MSQGYRRKRKSHRKLVYLLLVELLIIFILLLVLFMPSKVHRKVNNNNNKNNVQKTLVKDKEAPVITGVKDQIVNLNGTISYKKGVTVTDNQDKNPKLTIDTSKVDLGKEGTYTVVYTATDKGKNQTKREAKITVMSQSNYANKDEMNTLVTSVLSQIIKPNMTKLQMAKAIYTWTNTNINYTDVSDKSSWISGAIQGLKTRSGDCFQYFAVAKALLTQAGIDNVDVVKSDTSESSHFWSLVNVGEGYYHFDATPRKGEGDYFFMLTDAQLEAYSKTHQNSHVFDSALYPKRATTPIVE